MDYIIYISTDFGEIKVCFETEGVLKNENEALEIALEKLSESEIINVDKITSEKNEYCFEIEVATVK